ncbi:MAG: hypothetical protein COA46_07620 [Porticoccaceae bacterium]|nr:MAG: hypothetical protein COA46_07620 [Porticoccaceae bacterium]
MEVKVEIYKNKMILFGGGSSCTVTPVKPFSTNRLLIGTFMPAIECLKSGLKQLGAVGLFKPKPNLKLLAQEMNEGGLSEVEERCLLEVGHASGAGKVSRE